MSLQVAGLLPTFFRPRKTKTAGTRIQSLVPPLNKRKAKVTTLKYTAGTTAHTLTLLRMLGWKPGYLTAAAAPGATTVTINRDPGKYAANASADGVTPPSVADQPIASGDYIALRRPDDSWHLTSVNGAPVFNADGTVTLTLTDALPASGSPLPAGVKTQGTYDPATAVYWFGTTTSTDPRTGEPHPQYSGAASATTSIDGNGGSVCEAVGLNEPILFDSDNSTAAGTLELMTGVYADR